LDQGSPPVRALILLLSGGLALLPCARLAHAQDERRVASPDGQVEFRVFLLQPSGGALPRISYQVRRAGRLVVDTSFLGFNIFNQEPILGENDGLTSSHTGEGAGYRWLVAEYMQNGSIGRRINIEVRAWDQGVAFRYVIPRSTPLDEILIEDELTEFNLAERSEPTNRDLPAAVAGPAGEWIGISETTVPGFPRMSLSRTGDGILRVRLPRSSAYPLVAFEGRTPLVCPWRILTFAGEREQALHPALPALSDK
jgi:alpha-glucosidase